MALNAGFTHAERLDDRAAGRTVHAHLSARFPRATAEEWRARIERGEVLLDDRPAAVDAPLRAGQTLAWVRPPWEEPDAPLEFLTLFEDEALLAVAKPAGLPTMPGGGFLEHTLLALVRRLEPRANPMHRLGRGTSGLVLFTRTKAAGIAVQEAWRDGHVCKRYRALAQGRIGATPFEIEAPIGPIEHPLLGTLHAADPAGRQSRSLVRALEPRGDDTLVEVEIPTGRPHQIRIHLAFAGHPLVGDPLYVAGGRPSPGATTLPGELGYHLHACTLSLPHPTTGARLALSAPPPPPLRLAAER